MVDAGAEGGEGNGELVFNWDRVSDWESEKIRERDDGEKCTPV